MLEELLYTTLEGSVFGIELFVLVIELCRSRYEVDVVHLVGGLEDVKCVVLSVYFDEGSAECFERLEWYGMVVDISAGASGGEYFPAEEQFVVVPLKALLY